MKTVTAWSVNVVWSDGTEEVLADNQRKRRGGVNESKRSKTAHV